MMARYIERMKRALRPDDEPSERIDSRALKVWLISGLLRGSFLLILSIVFLAMGTRFYGLPSFVGWFAVGLAMIYSIWEALIAPQLRYRFWRYDIRDEEIDIQHGILVIRRNLIPMVRVQHVDTEHGPLMRHFGLATLSVSTAATSFHIPALTLEKAAELRRKISVLAKVSDEDV